MTELYDIFYFVILALINWFFTKKKDRSIINPLFAFIILWMMVLGLYECRFFDLLSASDEAKTIIWIGTLMFTIGVWIAYCTKNIKIKKRKTLLLSGNIRLRYSLLIFLAIVCVIYYVPSLAISLYSMARGITLNDVRSLIQNSDYSTGFANFIPNFVILPISIALEPLAILDFWFGKRNKKFIFIVLVLVLVRTVADGGRTPVFNMLMYFVIGYLLKKKYNKEYKVNIKRFLVNKVSKKETRRFRMISIIGVILLLCFSIMRAAGTLIRKLYFYFSMSPVLLTYWINNKSTNYYHGIISFNGLFYFVDYLRKNLTRSSYIASIYEAYTRIHLTDSTWIKISSSGTTANAYVSCFWFFFSDGGYIGIVVLTMLWGILVGRKYYDLSNENCTIQNIAIYLLLYQGVFFSFIRFPFAKTYYWLAFIVFLFAFKKEGKMEYKLNESEKY